MVIPGEVDDALQAETQTVLTPMLILTLILTLPFITPFPQECAKYGPVNKVLIFEVKTRCRCAGEGVGG